MAVTESQNGSDGWEVNKTTPRSRERGWAGTHCSTKRRTGNNDRVSYAPTMSVSKTIMELVCGLMYLLNCNCNKSFDQIDGIRGLLFAPSSSTFSVKSER